MCKEFLNDRNSSLALGQRLLIRSAMGLTTLAALAAASGCYERVTSARGFGADSVEVSESYQESSRLDDWIFGKDESKSKSLLKRR